MIMTMTIVIIIIIIIIIIIVIMNSGMTIIALSNIHSALGLSMTSLKP
mgnify:CR=1 FL=1